MKSSLARYLTIDIIIAGVAFTASLTFFHAHIDAVAGVLCGDRSTLYSPVASIFGALLGFLITALSIIIAVSSNERLRVLRPMREVWGVYTASSAFVAAATFVPVLGLIVDRAAGAPSAWLLSLVLATSLSASWSLIRCIRILKKVGNVVSASVGTSDV